MSNKTTAQRVQELKQTVDANTTKANANETKLNNITVTRKWKTINQQTYTFTNADLGKMCRISTDDGRVIVGAVGYSVTGKVQYEVAQTMRQKNVSFRTDEYLDKVVVYNTDGAGAQTKTIDIILFEMEDGFEVTV